MRALATVGTLILIAAQLPFLWNLLYSLAFGVRAERNPWRANTLEWQADSPPPHGNFSPCPVVHRWPYDYSLPGAPVDHLPQTAAPAAAA